MSKKDISSNQDPEENGMTEDHDNTKHKTTMGNWILNDLNTTMVFERLDNLSDINSARLVTAHFARLGRTPQWKLRQSKAEQSLIAEIEANYPKEIVTALGGAKFIARLPILNIRLGHPDPRFNYIDPAHLGEHPVVRGKNPEGHHFICFNILDINMSHHYVMTLFQTESGNQLKWKASTSSLSIAAPVFCDLCLNVPQNLSRLLNTIQQGPTTLHCPEDFQGRMPFLSEHRLQLINSCWLTAAQIQTDFPDFIVEGLGLHTLLKLPVLQLGDRQSGDRKINFVNSRDQGQPIQFGRDINNNPFICFLLELTSEGYRGPITLSLYKRKAEHFEYSAVHFVNEPPFFLPVPQEIVCNLGIELVNPKVASEKKVAILRALFLGSHLHSISSMGENQVIRPPEHSQLQCTVNIDQSPFDLYPEYIKNDKIHTPPNKDDDKHIENRNGHGHPKSCISM